MCRSVISRANRLASLRNQHSTPPQKYWRHWTMAQSEAPYRIPYEAEKLFREGVLQNSLISKELPPEIEECSKLIRFEGSDDPSIPVNWRLAESVSALKALEGAIANVLLKRKYGLEPQEIVINTCGLQIHPGERRWLIAPQKRSCPAIHHVRDAVNH